MCFSAQASFMASATLSIISALCFKKAKNNAGRLLASAPLFFGVQQALEGIVWMTLNAGNTTSMLHILSVYGFLFFAYIFWPLYMPGTLYVMESHATRKKIIFGLFILGGLVAGAGIIALSISGYTAHALNHHIVYEPTAAYTLFSTAILTYLQYSLLALYTIATIGSCLLSTTPYVWLCGTLIALGFVVAHVQYTASFGSVWCFFGALTSVVIYYTLDRLSKSPFSQ